MKFKTLELSAVRPQLSVGKNGKKKTTGKIYRGHVKVTRVSHTTRSIIKLQFIFRLYFFIFFSAYIFCIEHSQDKLNDSFTVYPLYMTVQWQLFFKVI